MQPLCTLCNVLMNLGESVYVIKCGHLFHHHCLVHWSKRSETCPHCHLPVTSNDLFLVNPTLSNAPRDDLAIMQLEAKLNDAKKELERLSILCNFQEGQINKLRIGCKVSDDAKKTYEDKLEKLVDKVNQLNKTKIENESLKSELQNATKILDEANSRVRELREENGKLNRNIQTLNRNLSSSRERLSSCNDTIAALKEQLADAKKLQTNDENQTLKRNLDTLNENLSNAGEKLAAEKLTVDALKEEIDNLKKAKEKLKRENERKLNSVNEKLECRESDVAALKKQLETAKAGQSQKANNNGLKEENDILRKTLETSNKKLSTALENLASQTNAVAELKVELSKAQRNNGNDDINRRKRKSNFRSRASSRHQKKRDLRDGTFSDNYSDSDDYGSGRSD